jgi:hypothetical protein
MDAARSHGDSNLRASGIGTCGEEEAFFDAGFSDQLFGLGLGHARNVELADIGENNVALGVDARLGLVGLLGRDQFKDGDAELVAGLNRFSTRVEFRGQIDGLPDLIGQAVDQDGIGAGIGDGVNVWIGGGCDAAAGRRDGGRAFRGGRWRGPWRCGGAPTPAWRRRLCPEVRWRRGEGVGGRSSWEIMAGGRRGATENRCTSQGRMGYGWGVGQMGDCCKR